MPPRALIVCPEPPYPLRGGGALRTAAVLHYLAQRYTLDAVFFSEETRPDPREALPAGLVRDSLLIRLPEHSRATVPRVSRNMARLLRGVPPLFDRFSGFDEQLAAWARGRQWHTGWVEHLWCASYAALLRPTCQRLVLDLHNIESEWHARMAVAEPFPLSAAHRVFAARARLMEQRWITRFDHVLVTSAREQRIVPSAAVYPNTIPEWDPLVEPASPVAKRLQIVFSGNLEYHPNKISVKWFFENVWPLLRARHPDLAWVLVGRAPNAVRPLVAADSRVRLTGEVEDALPEIAASMVAVVPVLAGSGTRIKILEAWKAGTAVVSTRLGAEGLPKEGVALADSAEDFASEVSRLISSQEERAVLSAVGTHLFNKTFTWRAGWNILSEIGI